VLKNKQQTQKREIEEQAMNMSMPGPDESDFAVDGKGPIVVQLKQLVSEY
jgi:hypothetical protein